MPLKGYKPTKEHKEHLSKSHLGYVMPERQKRRIGEALKGGNNTSFQKGHIPWHKGKEFSQMIGNSYAKGLEPWNKGTKGIIKANSGSFKKGHKIARDKDSWAWKGDNAGYSALHKWIYNPWCLGRPKICEHCGVTAKETKLYWANKNHKYKRDLSDWISLCAKCHKAYDKNKFGGKAKLWQVMVQTN